MIIPIPVVLSVNAGSSSLKFAIYSIDTKVINKAVFTGLVDGLLSGKELLMYWNDGKNSFYEKQVIDSTQLPYEVALNRIRSLLELYAKDINLVAIAHRVVHGGSRFSQSIVMDQQSMQYLESLSELAPLHQPHNLEGIKIFTKYFPKLPQIACFDTTFHRTLGEVEKHFALPNQLSNEGVLRYGFHGLSYEYVSQELVKYSPQANKRLLMAHLGSGASLCGSIGLQSKATTMGFSTLDGLMMGSRSGSVDPGVVLYLLKRNWTYSKIEDLLYCQSGLKGVSGISSDMRKVRASDDPQAKFAVDLFVYRAIREFGALTACIGGVDVIAFTGGIGEHDPQTRSEICRGLGFLGVIIDEQTNTSSTGALVRSIHSNDSKVEVWVVPTDEGRIAAQHAIDLISYP